jgi:hypothetical protein
VTAEGPRSTWPTRRGSRLADEPPVGAWGRAAPGGGAPIKRAVGNLLSALWHRVTREEMDEDRLHEIAEILDEAARKIERLK